MTATEILTPATTRRAGLLAATGALLLGSLALVLPALALPRRCSTDDDVVTCAVIAVAAAALLRLAWICARTAAQLRTEARTMPATLLTDRRGIPATTGGPNTPTGTSRGRTARFFLALATVTMLSAPAAHASTSPPSPPVAASSASPGDIAPTPGFSITATTTQQPTTDAATGDTTSIDAPTSSGPGWTPSAQTIAPAAASLALGVIRAEQPDAARIHVVTRGESLWSIAASRLGPHAPAEQVAEAVEAWLDVNPCLRQAPDLIHPGQMLDVPGQPDLSPTFASTTGDLR